MITNKGGSRNASSATECFIFNSTFISSYKNFIRLIKLLNKIYIDAFFFKFTAIADLPAFFNNIVFGKVRNQFYVVRRACINQKITMMVDDKIDIVHF